MTEMAEDNEVSVISTGTTKSPSSTSSETGNENDTETESDIGSGFDSNDEWIITRSLIIDAITNHHNEDNQ